MSRGDEQNRVAIQVDPGTIRGDVGAALGRCAAMVRRPAGILWEQVKSCKLNIWKKGPVLW
ncbi:hypothetical protein [Gimesia maris]|uniref:hypothetical protein n=1 Tax=Gimesia maris TaxID=122 RepID=UPI003A940140